MFPHSDPHKQMGQLIARTRAISSLPSSAAGCDVPSTGSIPAGGSKSTTHGTIASSRRPPHPLGQMAPLWADYHARQSRSWAKPARWPAALIGTLLATLLLAGLTASAGRAIELAAYYSVNH